MADEYSKFIIKDYEYWTVYIHQNQGYLGRCIVWCKRENAIDLTQATFEEQKELFVVLNDLKNAITKVFQPDWFNYSFLGNDTHHLHGHFIPRYSKSKEFLGITFKDERWGHNYKTDHDFKVPSDVLNAIQGKIKEII
jgi:diadenosine tetraphosphate (Ap4A) HIT family hydrolase